eukprot:5427183-Ditylum_brightwellii.AAC.1
MQWAVALGQIGIIAATVTMARFRPVPCQGHLKCLNHVYHFLHNYKKTAIKFDTEMPNYSNYKAEKKNQGHIYHPCQEEIPDYMPEPHGKPVAVCVKIPYAIR